MADGDVHFVISAEDKASAVLDAFNGKMESALNNMASSMQSALGKIDALSSSSASALEQLFSIISNPSPFTVLAGAATAAGGAFLYLQNMVKQADEEFKASNATAESMAGTWKEIAALRLSNDTAGMGAGAKDIATFNSSLDAKPLAGLSKEDAARRDSLRMNIDKYGAFMGKSEVQESEAEIAALNKKEAEARNHDAMLRDQAKRQYADEISRREGTARGAAGTKDFRAAMGSMGGQVADAQFAAKTAGMTEVQKKLAEFEKQWLNMDTSKMSSEQARQVNEAYVVERRRLETALELEASIKRQSEGEAEFLKINQEIDEEERKAKKAADEKATKRGKEITEKNYSPDQQYAATNKELSELRASGKIDQQTFIRGIAAAMHDLTIGRQKEATKFGDPLKAAENNAPIVSRLLTRGAGDSWDPAMQLRRDMLTELRDMKREHIAIRKWLEDYKRWIEGRGNYPGKRPVRRIPGGPV